MGKSEEEREMTGEVGGRREGQNRCDQLDREGKELLGWTTCQSKSVEYYEVERLERANSTPLTVQVTAMLIPAGRHSVARTE